MSRVGPGASVLIAAMVTALYYFIAGAWWIGGLSGLFLPFSATSATPVFWLLAAIWLFLAIHAVMKGRWIAMAASVAILLLAALPAAWGAHGIAEACARGACL